MEQKTLQNGLTVVFEPISFFRSASFGIWVRCGSQYETEGENGASHFIEHMAFKGTERLVRQDIAVKTDLVRRPGQCLHHQRIHLLLRPHVEHPCA